MNDYASIMNDYASKKKEELLSMLRPLQEEYNAYKAQGLKLDMSRGKPSPEQLDLSNPMIHCLDAADYKTQTGADCRNYGPDVAGIPEARKLFADLLDVDPSEIIVGGNSSLNMMYDALARAIGLGVLGGEKPWGKREKVKFLCPSPGYDRHFAMCEQFGIEMIPVKMLDDGPDMNFIEVKAGRDEDIKGIWCVPKYSNPEGKTYSRKVVKRLAEMKTKAQDFRIFWDNAYAMHHLTDEPEPLANILDECRNSGNPDRVFMFTSTSKITFPGAGVAAMAASKTNIDFLKKQIGVQTLGTDKLNQLRHVRFFGGIDGIKAHMKKHAAILKPKFDLVSGLFEERLRGKNIAWWNNPKGGYFISLDLMKGCAGRVAAMAAEAGVTLTGAGAAYPYGRDPDDRHLRIAPSMPPLKDLQKAGEVLCTCIEIASIEKLLER